MDESFQKRAKISAFVISYNRQSIIGTTLKALTFVDELILIDKSSTDATVEIGSQLVDRVVVVPWTPTADDTRTFAASLCSHEWILFLDDDECLTPEAVRFIDQELRQPRADVYRFPLRHYILGVHDEDAYYWPEGHIRLYRKGAVEFSSTIHNTLKPVTDNLCEIPVSTGAAIIHLSHVNVAQWIEKTNRYTSQRDRTRMLDEGRDIIAFAHRSIDKWVARSHSKEPGGYPATAAVLRSTYDLIDRLKTWEEERGLDGEANFTLICRELEARYEAELPDLRRSRFAGKAVEFKEAEPPPALSAQFSDETLALLIQTNAALADILRATRLTGEELRLSLGSSLARERTARLVADQKVERLTALNDKLFRSDHEMSLIRASLFYGPMWDLMKIENKLRPIVRKFIQLLPSRKTRGQQTFKLNPRQVPKPNSINLAVSASPLVSIIIPTYGKINYTLRCLLSIQKSETKFPIEILVVDDASGDPQIPTLELVQGIKVSINDRNLGFLRSCNAAAQKAVGKYLLFLNNDTVILPDAIDSLVEIAEQRPEVGLAGSKLVYPDGRLQEAGGIIWNDGSAWQYGHGDDPQKPHYNYVREVDYISGASILVRRDLWNRLGGFDEIFVPAYCEDTDLAFRIRREGFKVLYQPRSTVIHFEGISHGRDLNKGIKAFQVTNQKKLLDRWRDVLERDQFPSGENLTKACDRAKNRPMIAVIDHYVPEPDRDAGSRTMIEMLRFFLSCGWLVKFWPQDLQGRAPYTQVLQQMGIEVLYGSNLNFQTWLEANGSSLDYVLLSRPTVAGDYLPDLRTMSSARVAYYGHDLHFERMQLQARRNQDQKLAEEAERMELIERSLWKDVDLVLYPSQSEVDVVLALDSNVKARAIVPYGFETFAVRDAPPSEPSIIFVAGFAHPPNVDAAVWLVDEILPLVRMRVPGVKLYLVGSNPTERVRGLTRPDVEVTGSVTDTELTKHYGAARVAVVPLRFGAGVKLKVVEPMRMGLPLVTTMVGSQGLPEIGNVVMLADETAAFADACVKLLRHDDVWRKQSAAQTEYIRGRFSLDAMRSSLAEAFMAMGVQKDTVNWNR